MKKNNNYKVIAFDLGNTVIRFDHHISATKLADLFKMDPLTIYNKFFDSETTRAFDRGHLSPEDFHRNISAELGFNMPFHDFVNTWSDIFWSDEAMSDIVRSLKGRYKLYLLSNINSIHFDRIKSNFDIIKEFDELVLSYQVGAIKPEPLIYNDLIRRAGGDKSSILYVDDREDLIKEATAMGIDSIRFENAVQLKSELHRRNIG